MRIHKFGFFILLFLVYSCRKGTNRDVMVSASNTMGDLDSIRVEFIKDIPSDYLIDQTELIFLNTGDLIIGEVSKILFFNDKFVLSDKRNSVYCFSISGDLLFHVSALGLGPEEYNAIDDFGIFIEENTLEILDLVGQKVVRFNLSSGEFLDYKEFEFFTYTFSPLQNGDRIFHNSVMPNGNYSGDDSLNASVFITDKKNTIKKVMFKFSDTYADKSRLVTFHNLFVNYKSEVLYIPLYDNIVYRIADDTLRPYYFLDFSDRVLPKSFLEDYDGGWREFPDLLYTTDYVHSISDFFESHSHFTFKFISGVEQYWAIYDKESKKCFATSNLSRTSSGLISKPLAIFGKYHVSVIEAEEILGMIRLLEKDLDPLNFTKSKMYRELIDLKGKNESENPILLMNTFRNISSESLK